MEKERDVLVIRLESWRSEMFVLKSTNEMINPELLKGNGWNIARSYQANVVGGLIHIGSYVQGVMKLHVRTEIMNCDIDDIDTYGVTHYKLELDGAVVTYTRNPITIRGVIASIKAFGDHELKQGE